MPSLGEQPVLATPPPVESKRLLTRYTYLELFAIGQLLDQLARVPNQAEGESSLGCRILPEDARRWSKHMKGLLNESASRERLSYQENPLLYQRSRNFDHCVPKCTCAALSSIVRPVAIRFFQGPELRAAHRNFLKKLEIKTSRETPQELHACLERQSWFCASDLLEFFENSP